MSSGFRDRLGNDCLRTIEDYRNLQVKLHAMKKDRESVNQSTNSEDWRSWDLAPLEAPVQSKAEPTVEGTTFEPSADAVKGVHKALRTIDKF